MEEKYEENECFICFEVSKQYEKYPLRLKYLQEYIKSCSCDGWIHDICLETWYNRHETCPICRNKMIYVNFELQYGFYIIHYLVLGKNLIRVLFSHIVKIRNFLILCVIITNIMNIISITLHNFDKNNTCNKYDYIYESKYVYMYESKYDYIYESKYDYNLSQICL
jgi:hypothetical protein